MRILGRNVAAACLAASLVSPVAVVEAAHAASDDSSATRAGCGHWHTKSITTSMFTAEKTQWYGVSPCADFKVRTSEKRFIAPLKQGIFTFQVETFPNRNKPLETNGTPIG